MRILFDHNTPSGVARYLAGHDITKAKECGWERLTNGDLLAAAEQAAFDLLLTDDKNMRYQQNLSGRKIALVVLGNSPWPLVWLHLDENATVVNAASPVSFTEVDIPFSSSLPSH